MNNHGGATSSDACSGVTWSNNFTSLSDDCGSSGFATVMFTATDDCGNISTTTATFTIVDTTPPVIDTPSSDYYANCDGQGNTVEFDLWLTSNGNGASASDICSNSVSWAPTLISTTSSCGNTGSWTYMFTAYDDCGNASTTSATFTIEDFDAPSIDVAAGPFIAQCDGQGNTNEFALWYSSHAGAQASDICSNVTWSDDYNISNWSSSCGNTGSVTVTFTATDDCGNASTTSATFTIEDTTPPQISCPSNITVNTDPNVCSANVNFSVTGSDICSNVSIVSVPASGSTFQVGTTTVHSVATDGCGNTTSCEFTVTVNSPTISLASPLLNGGRNLSCFGGNDGSINLTLTNVTAPVTFNWSGPNGYSSTDQNPIGLVSGSYYVTVYNGCTRTASINLSQPSPINYSAVKVNELCNGGNNGSITINASGGVSSYQYSSDNGSNWQNSNVFSSLTAGTYIVRVKDANDCQNNYSSIVVTQPNPITVNITMTNVTCNGLTNGAITLTSGGGTGTKTYSITGGAPYFNSGIFSNLSASTYSVIVKDANNCLSSVINTPVTQPAAVTFTTVVTNPSPCTGTNGRIVVTASGGNNFYNYSKNGGTNWQGSTTFSNLSTGDYNVKVKDASGCMSGISSVHVGCNVRESSNDAPSLNYMTAYPNPASDQVTVVFNSDKNATYTLNLTDVTGRTVLTQAGNLVEGSNQFELNLATFAKGVYVITLQNGDDTRKLKLIIQ